MTQQNEIDQIMSEIENLQNSMEMAATSPPTAEPESAEPVMADFQGSSGDASLEDTLSSIEEEKGSGQGALSEGDESHEIKSMNSEQEALTAEIEAQLSTPVVERMSVVPAPAETKTVPTAVAAPTSHTISTVARPSIAPVPIPTGASTTSAPGIPGSPGALSMTLSGQMTLHLKYAYGDQEVVIGFENDYLTVELSDGTEFKIPVAKKPKHLRAAS